MPEGCRMEYSSSAPKAPRRRGQRWVKQAFKAGACLSSAAALSCTGMLFFEPVVDLSGNFANSALLDNPRVRLTARQILSNRDLAQLMGDTIALVLRFVAEEVLPEPTSEEPAEETLFPNSRTEAFKGLLRGRDTLWKVLKVLDFTGVVATPEVAAAFAEQLSAILRCLHPSIFGTVSLMIEQLMNQPPSEVLASHIADLMSDANARASLL